MSKFSVKLSEYIERSDTTIISLSQQSGFEATHITRFKKGNRKPLNQTKLEKLFTALQLSPSEYKELYELWQIEQIGEDVYQQHMAVKELILSLNQRTEIKQEMSENIKDDQELCCVYSGKQNVLFALKQTLEITSRCPENHIRMVCQPDEDMFTELIFLICNMKEPVSIRHIISMYGSDAAKNRQLKNLTYLKNLLPCALSNPLYEVWFYYDRSVLSDNHYLLMPNVFITAEAVMLISSDWNNCIIHKDEKVLHYYKMLFDRQYKVSRSLGYSVPSLFDELQFLIKNLVDEKVDTTNTFFSIDYQPCLLPYIEPADCKYLFPGYENMDMLINMFFTQYQPIFIKNVNAVHFFRLDGLKSFLRTGQIWEVGKDNMNPFTPEDRIKLIHRMCKNVRQGHSSLYILKEDELPMPKDAVLSLYQNNFLAIHTRTSQDHIYGMNESGVTKTIREFFLYLRQSDMVYTVKESLQMVEDEILSLDV